jgi:hypothetical protein
MRDEWRSAESAEPIPDGHHDADHHGDSGAHGHARAVHDGHRDRAAATYRDAGRRPLRAPRAVVREALKREARI